MTDPQPRDKAITAAESMTAAVTRLTGEVKALRTYGHRNRAFIVVDVVLTVALTVFGAVAVHARDAAAQADAAQLALCQSSNTARAQQVGLWAYLIGLSPPPKTAQGRDLIAKFEDHLHAVFAPRDCARLGQHDG